MTEITLVSSNKSFGGQQRIYSHDSKELSCSMKFAIYLPSQCVNDNEKLPVVYWLSGLTCTEANFIEKAGAQKYADKLGLIIVCPDTSPRNIDIPGQDDSYDFGSGAGFYVDATAKPWNKNYRMFSYVTSELISIINANFPVQVGNQSICGHSMGGHGALICALKNPGLYKSVSAFAPIANPMQCAWGQKAMKGYFGENCSPDICKQWDASELVGTYDGPPIELLIDQGTDDKFLAEKQLLPQNLIEACQKANMPIIYYARDGYDHGYYYIATFIEEHLIYHSKHLK